MGLKKDSTMLVDELIAALSDKWVLHTISGVVEAKLQWIFQSVSILENENNCLAIDMEPLQSDLQLANSKIGLLESYNRLDNLFFTGLPVMDHSEAASVNNDNPATESSLCTERAILELVNNTKTVPITRVLRRSRRRLRRLRRR